MRHWRGAIAPVVAAAVWWVLAARTPTSTFHFAPLIVAAAWVVIEGGAEAGLTPRLSLRLGAAGFGLAVLVTAALDQAGHLEGPVFWANGDDAPVVAEHFLFALLGAVGGVGFAVRRAFRVSS